MAADRPCILAMSSYFKGNRFLSACRRRGAHVVLLTVEKLLADPWVRDDIDEVFALPTFDDRRALLNAISWLTRTRDVKNVVALDDFDVEVAGAVREHLRLPGYNESTSRFYRDKLAMRDRAGQAGIREPRFVGVFNNDRINRFLEETPGPWLLKPRSSASAMGIQKHTDRNAIWQAIEALGDDRSFHLIEEMLPGSMFHVDSLIVGGEVVFSEANGYHKPLLDVWQGGGVFASRTLPRESADAVELRRLNALVHKAFGLVDGPSHTEFLKHAETGEFHFIETSARVGGANITDMVEAATGLNLWEAWADLEVLGRDYRLPAVRRDYGGVTVSLARQEEPDYSSFTDPEITYQLKQKHHVGLVVGAKTPERVEELLSDYMGRIQRDFAATLPPVDHL